VQLEEKEVEDEAVEEEKEVEEEEAESFVLADTKIKSSSVVDCHLLAFTLVFLTNICFCQIKRSTPPHSRV
jgi:hypothetical protein